MLIFLFLETFLQQHQLKQNHEINSEFTSQNNTHLNNELVESTFIAS